MKWLLRLLFSPEGDGGGGEGGEGGGSGETGGSGGGEGSGEAGGGNVATLPEWVKSLPEDAAKDPEVTKYKTSDEFYKAYRNKTEMLGRKGVILPKDDAAPEEVEKFYNALGRPEKPEGYKIAPSENLHKSIQLTAESISGYQMLAHKHGLTQKQADGMNKDYLAVMDKAARAAEARENEAVQKADTALRKEWGPKFDTNRSLIVKAVLKTGGKEALDAMGGENGIGNNPVILRMLGNWATLINEDQLNTIQIENGKGGGTPGNETKEQALEKINAMMNDPKHPINDERNPKRSEAIEERMRLYKIAYPNESEE